MHGACAGNGNSASSIGECASGTGHIGVLPGMAWMFGSRCTLQPRYGLLGEN